MSSLFACIITSFPLNLVCFVIFDSVPIAGALLHPPTPTKLERIQEFGLAGQKSNGSGSTVRLALVNLGESKMEETPSEVWEGSAPVPQWCNAPALTRATDCLIHVASMQFALHYMFERYISTNDSLRSATRISTLVRVDFMS